MPGLWRQPAVNNRQPSQTIPLYGRNIRRVAFWQNQASHHQAPVLEAIARQRDIQVDWIVGNRLETSARAQQGWPQVDCDLVRTVYAPDHDIPSLVRQNRDSSLHIFSGVYFNPTVRQGYLAALRQGALIAKMAESPPPPGLVLASEKMTLAKRMRIAMPLVHRLERALVGEKVLFTLCIGNRSKTWWAKVGYQDSRLFPWAYIPPESTSSELPKTNNVFRFVYLGELSAHKGVDTILQAALAIPGQDFTIDLYGTGPMQSDYAHGLKEAGMADRVKFHGFKPWQEAMAALATADASLVPSRYDGWGAVTTESLVRGVPVIVGNGAGSSVLIKSDTIGTIVESGSAESLARAMTGRIAKGPLSPADRNAVQSWADCLDPDRIAEYFWQIVDHTFQGTPPPAAPWEPNT